jgi:hypothetical protein
MVASAHDGEKVRACDHSVRVLIFKLPHVLHVTLPAVADAPIEEATAAGYHLLECLPPLLGRCDDMLKNVEFSFPAAVPHIHVMRHVVCSASAQLGASLAAAVAGQRSGLLDLGLRLAIMSGELYTALTGLRHALGLPPPNPYPLPRSVDRLCPRCIAEV